MVVIDPRVTETAALADYHLRVRPGRDAWLVAAMAAVLVDEGLVNRASLAESHAVGYEPVLAALGEVPIGRYCEVSGVDEALVRAATRRIAAASSVATFEDLGVQMNRHSTLVSYLEKLVWLLTGNLAIPGGQYAMTGLGSILRMAETSCIPTAARCRRCSGRVIGGFIPCNVIAEEILADHPKRYRAMFVESGNPVHSVADSQRMREAMRALDVSVCIDVFMTETARECDYVLPATTQFEKFEATFFNFEYPKNYFHLRRPVLDPPAGPLPEPEIHARLVAALGLLDDGVVEALRRAAERSRVRVRGARSPRRRPPTPGSPPSRRPALPHARRDAAARRGRCRGAVADGGPLRPGQPRRRRPRRLRRRDPTPATGCSTRSSTARRGSCSPTTPGRRRGNG